MQPRKIARRRSPRTRLARLGLAVMRDSLPQGRLLPEHEWARRHRRLVWLLWLHVPALVVFAVARGAGPLHSLVEAQVLVALALLAGWAGASRMVRSVAASLGLVTCSALLVHLWDGTTEAHFHFFVVVSLLILYQDWMPFLLAIAYVIVHHGVLGVLAPGDVYGTSAGAADPWLWAAIHGAFVLAACAANVVSWRANEQLLHDPLTGLATRVVLRDRLGLALARGRRSGRHVALLFLDLDRFKLVNDSLGHSAGDRLLRMIGDRLRTFVRSSDTAVRFGGDEFAVLCEDLDEPRDAIRVAERLLEALSEPYRIGGHELAMSASIGIAMAGDQGAGAEELMRDADAAMYRAKERGRNRIEIFDADVRASLLRELELEQDLRHALARGELRLHYRPEISLATGRVDGVEALLRWQHPRRGLMPPLDFIPYAELSGLIVPIGAWVIEEACGQAQRWRLAVAGPAPTVRVNVSARQLADPGLYDIVTGALADTATPPHQLCLEITESALAEDSETAACMLKRIRDLGVRLAVEDFGTGYSSLDRLRRFEVDFLKIDRAFVSALADRPDDVAIVHAIVALAHALGLTVTAEGIEDPAQLAIVRELGCDAGQGHLFAQPGPAEDIEAQLVSERGWPASDSIAV
jgi:diguanylate cyclase (GGDEF)-like protein